MTKAVKVGNTRAIGAAFSWNMNAEFQAARREKYLFCDKTIYGLKPCADLDGCTVCREMDAPEEDDGSGKSFQTASVEHAGVKTVGHVNKRDGYSHRRHLTNQAESDHIKQPGCAGARDNGKGDRWFQDGAAQSGSKSTARKAASAAIAKIPISLARHIAKTYYPA